MLSFADEQSSHTNSTSTFDFNALIDGQSRTFPVRVVTLEGQPWFVAVDACRALGLKAHPRGGFNHHTVHLAADEKKRLERHTHSSDVWASTPPQVVLLGAVNESGLYKQIMRSDKPQARPFQD